ncbi:MAG: signal peptidase I [Lachnospiraceae bacterium]|nr:signal peptidase I [Lachnospiraceae bacterium]
MKKIIQKHKNLILALSILFMTGYLSRYHFQLALIQGDSMLPTYHNLELVIINKHVKQPDYGDVIVFSSDTLSTTLIKRVVAKPNDMVSIEENILYVNDEPSSVLPENAQISYAGTASSPLLLHEDEYFVLGDNYSESKDSRCLDIGPVKYEDIIGTVMPSR